jgi:predicted enzyme related to lactoylglutathione lyase
MLFDFNPEINLTGGIQRIPESTGMLRCGGGGGGGVCMYWFVEDVNAIGEVIEKAGGKMRSGVEKEGKNGVFRYFEDTEGTVGAVYQLVESNEGL